MTPTPMDYSRLLVQMQSCGMTQTELAKAVGIKPERMKQKLNSLLYFTLKEMRRICEVLEVPEAEMKDYFYTPKGDEEIPEPEQPSMREARERLIDYGTELMKPGSCRREMRGARVMEVIEARTMAGSGTKEDPKREQVTYWSLDGELLGYGV